MNMKLALFTLLVLFLVSLLPAYAETIFVFNPEARISKIKKVKSGLEKYLRPKWPSARVYIFANSKDFQNSVSRLKPDLAIVASYYFSSMENTYRWKTALSGHKKGVKRFSKVLVTLNSITSLRQLKNKSLATVSIGLSYVNSLLPPELSVENNDIRIVSVSKDLDAIMALGFEQVQAAIVTKNSFSKLKKINPDAIKNLHVLQRLSPTPYPKVVVFPRAKHVKNLISKLKKMPYKRSTRTVLRFFGITGFSEE